MDRVRTIPEPGFAGDVGAADARLTAALEKYDAAPDSRVLWTAAVAVLQDTRLLVPIVAAEQPVSVEKSTDMAAVLMQSRSGRTALLSFTGLASLRTWDPAARPVPVSAADAAKAALQNGATGLVVDVAGPVLFAVEDDDLRSLALGHRLVELAAGRWGWVAAG